MKKKMSHSITIALALTTAALAGTAMGESDAALPNQPTPFFVRYFDQVNPLYLTPGAIAIRPSDFNTTAADGWSPQLEAQLHERGIVPDPGQMVGVGNFVRARLLDTGIGHFDREITLRDAVAQLAEDPSYTFASPVFMDERGMPYIITEEIIVSFHENTDHTQALADFEAQGVTVVEANMSGLPGVYLLRSSSRNGFDVLDQANAFGERPEIAYAEPNAIIRGETFLNPNDPLFSQQWALHHAANFDMNGPQAWDISTGSSDIITVILDIGIQYDHPDLNNAPGQDFAGSTPNGGPTNSCDNHGTAVAGCISAILNNNTGIVGGTPGSRTASGKIGTAISIFGFCLGNFDSQPTMLTNALAWSVSSGARITNSSISYGVSSAVTNAYANARAQGVIHFAATGNSGSGSISYPSSLPSVNAIGATNSNGQKASFSQYGSGIFCVAPGEGILSTDRTGSAGYESGDYATVDGTSFASPYAASVAAMILSINPDLSVTEVEQIMQDTCIDMGATGYDTTFGWGRANLYGAALAAQETVKPVTPTGACCLADGDCIVNTEDECTTLAGTYNGDETDCSSANCPVPCPADINSDGIVNADDLGVLLNNFGTTNNAGDLNNDGVIDADDLGILLNSFGCVS